jgi:hypothetical protein
MAKLAKKTQREIESAINLLTEVLTILEQPKTLGIAKAIDNNRALGSDYDLRNPACMESTSGLAEHIHVSPVHGSKVIYLWTVRDVLRKVLNPPKVIVTTTYNENAA